MSETAALPEDVTLYVERPIAGPYRQGSTVTCVRTPLVDAWIEAGIFTVVHDADGLAVRVTPPIGDSVASASAEVVIEPVGPVTSTADEFGQL